MRHGNQRSASLEDGNGLLRADKFPWFVGNGSFTQIAAESFATVFHDTASAEKFGKMRSSYYAPPGKSGGLFITDIKTEPAQAFGYALVAYEPFFSHVFKKRLKLLQMLFLPWKPETDEMSLSPRSTGTEFTAAHEDHAFFSGDVLGFGKPVEGVMIGKGYGIQPYVGGLAYDVGGRVGAVGGGAVDMEVDAGDIHSMRIYRSEKVSIFSNNGVDEESPWSTL